MEEKFEIPTLKPFSASLALLKEDPKLDCPNKVTGITFILGVGPTKDEATTALEKAAKEFLESYDKKCQESGCEKAKCRSEGWLLGEPAFQDQKGKVGLMHKLKLPDTVTALQLLLYGCFCIKDKTKEF